MKKTQSKHKAISLQLLTYIALRNLLANKLRTFLTIFGIVIGVGAIFFLVSFGLGLQQLVTEQVVGDESIKAIDVTSPNSKIIKLNNDAVNKMNELGSVDRVGRSYSFPGSLSYKGASIDMVTYGVDENYQDLSSLNLSAGRLLKNTDSQQVVVNKTALTSLGINDAKDALGKKIDVAIPISGLGARQDSIEHNFEIIGVVDSGSGGELFIPVGLFDAVGVPYYSQVKVVVSDTNQVEGLRKQIESLGFETASPVDTLDQINQVFKFFTIILGGFGAIGMVVSVLGMFNTLTISLLERTQEIGLMMAMGSRNRDMRRLFIIEAFILSVVGAAAGITLAVIGGKGVNLIMNSFAHGRGVTGDFELFSTPLWLMGALLVFMVIVGMLVVFFPSRRAAHINPLDALRRE
jgi:putative ABC transport system permease protein